MCGATTVSPCIPDGAPTSQAAQWSPLEVSQQGFLWERYNLFLTGSLTAAARVAANAAKAQGGSPAVQAATAGAAVHENGVPLWPRLSWFLCGSSLPSPGFCFGLSLVAVRCDVVKIYMIGSH